MTSLEKIADEEPKRTALESIQIAEKLERVLMKRFPEAVKQGFDAIRQLSKSQDKLL
jgi:hypothetical protein